MALDLGNIGQTTNRKPEELSLQGSGDRLSDRRLSHTRGADETDDFALHGSAKLSNGQKLQDPVLDILQSVMVLIQDLLGVGDRVVFLGMLTPWDLCRALVTGRSDSYSMNIYLGNPFQVVPRDVRLRSSGLEMA